MSIDKRSGRKVPEFLDSSRVPGINDPGPYIGMVKNNTDPTRSGRVQVFIPQFGGVETDQAHWVTVSYASPYGGSARRPNIETPPAPDNEYHLVNHSYGMWMTPPDIGNMVLVIFIGGDTNNGYWFACIQPDISHFATPAIGGSKYMEPPRDPGLNAALRSPPYPNVEFNQRNKILREKWKEFLTIPKPVHYYQCFKLLNQGLEDDKIRGVVSSSSQRESPSRVFGISTPGRDVKEDIIPATDKDSEIVAAREGGHTFVMDDGNVEGIDQLVRLKSANGHQILMNDKEEVMYIGNCNGTTWMEFTGDGKILVYGKNDITFRTEKNFNIHADNDINMFAKKNIKMYSGDSIQEQSDLITLKAKDELNEYGGKIQVTSGSTHHITSATEGSWGTGTDLIFSSGMIYLNTMPAPGTTPPVSIPVVVHPEPNPTMSAPYFKWKHTGKITSSTVPLDTEIPTHEPYTKHNPNPAIVNLVPTDNVIIQEYKDETMGGGRTASSSSGTAGPAAADGSGVRIRASADAVAAQTANYPARGIGSLTGAEVDALKAQTAAHESGGSYTKVGGDNNHFLGKYQVGAGVLDTQGYVKPGTKGAGLDDPANWQDANGRPLKDGVGSKQDFLNTPAVQEKVMDKNLQSNYNYLEGKGTINASSPNEDVAGKLQVAHLLGPKGAADWASGKGGADAFGTTGATYYNEGKYSNLVLAGKGSATGTTAPPQVALMQGGNIKPVA